MPLPSGLPVGIDWGDGIDGRFGTPTPVGTILYSANGGQVAAEEMPFEELPTSPEFERAEQATITHTYQMSWVQGINLIQFIGRGTILEDSNGIVTRVLSSKIQRTKANQCTLTITAESVSFDSPIDDFSVVPVELGINIMKHPRYFYALLGPDGQGSATEKKNQAVIRKLQDYMDDPNVNKRNTIIEEIYYSISTNNGGGTESGGQKVRFTPSSDPPVGTIVADAPYDVTTIAGTDLAKAAALEIIQKYWRGEETPYVVGYQITWISYYFRPPYVNPGGYVENPMTEAVPQLPDYFSSPNDPPDEVTIFDNLAVTNPQCYSSDGTQFGSVQISWLRKSDHVEFQRTWFKVERTWIGSPVGYWDEELYNRHDRPTTAAEFLKIRPQKPNKS